MDDLLLLVVQVLEPWQDLRDYQFGFFFLNLLVFFQVVVEVWSTTEFQDCAETVVVNFDCIEVFYNSAIVQLLVNLVFTKCMFNVVVLHLVTPTVIKVVDLASNFSKLFKVKSFIYFWKSTFAQNGQNQISVVKYRKSFASVDSTIFRLLFIPNPLEFQQVLALLFLKHVQLLPDSSFLVLKELDFKLINFFLFILVNILKLAILKCKLTVFVSFTKCISRHWWQTFTIGRESLLVLFCLLFLFFYFFFLWLYFAKSVLQFEYCFSFFPHLHQLCRLPNRT